MIAVIARQDDQCILLLPTCPQRVNNDLNLPIDTLGQTSVGPAVQTPVVVRVSLSRIPAKAPYPSSFFTASGSSSCG